MENIVFHIMKIIKENRDDIEYLLFVGFPAGLLCIFLSRGMDFTKLF